MSNDDKAPAGAEARLLEQIVENLPDMIFLKDARELRFMRFNRAGEALLGYDRKELLGKNDYDFFPRQEAEFFIGKDREVLQSGGMVDIPEERIHTRARGERILHTKKVPIFDASGKPLYLLGISEDITELVRTRRALSDTQAELDASRLREHQKMELLGVVAGGIAHEFNNLLVGIMGNAALAARRAQSDGETRRLVEEIQTAATRAAELTQQILAYSGRGRMVIEALDVSAVVDESATLLRASIDRRARLHMDLQKGATIEGDRSQIQQLVMNLLTNAGDALAGKPGEIAVVVKRQELDEDFGEGPGRIGRIARGPHVTIEVRDSGVGMDAAMLSRVFEPFFSTKQTGRGLGLAATVGIVESHGGAIRVRSAPGKGTTLRVSFPFHESPLHRHVPARAGASLPPGLTVLVVDDEAFILRVIEATLADAGVQCVTAPDGARALAIFERAPERFGAVLLDMSMPSMDGRTCMQHLRRLRPDLPVLLSSGYDESQDPIVASPRTAFLQKPYGIDVLLEALNAVIRAPA